MTSAPTVSLDVPGNLADILTATRMLLGAWDATLHQWETPAPPHPPGPVLTPEQALQVWVGAEPVQDLLRGKARALLMFLLLHRIRRQLHDPALLQHSDDGYQIVTTGEVWLDVEQFEQQVALAEQADALGDTARAIAHHELAATLYRSDLVDESEHERVLIARSQLLRDQLNQVLGRLSGLREDRGDLHGCLRTTQRHVGPIRPSSRPRRCHRPIRRPTPWTSLSRPAPSPPALTASR